MGNKFDIEKLLVIVPARGSSKGLPGKNTKILGGFPLIDWSIAAVQKANQSIPSTNIILSTDNEGIAKIGKECGFNVPFLRPTELATDNATTLQTVDHCVAWFEKERNMSPDNILLLQPTSPLRQPEKISEAITLLCESETDAVIGVKKIERSLSTLFFMDESNKLSSVSNSDQTRPRQSIDPLFTPNGALYLVRYEAYKNENTFFPRKSKALFFDVIGDLDIDDDKDFKMAQAMVEANLTWRKPRN